MNLENYFISKFNSKYIGDDGALIGNVVYSKDAFFENVHFKRKWMSCFEIAQKAMLVNISDAVAMNARPKYALLSVSMPKSMTKSDMEALANGFKSVAQQYNIEIIGGDTISNSKLDITVTIVSETKKPLLRSKVRQNYLFAYTGRLGDSAKDLKKLQNLGKIHKKSKFVNIHLRDKFVSNNIRILKAGMDISDGLYSDLDKMASLNRVGIQFLKKIPKCIACSGEEYEMLVAFDARDTKKLLMHAKKSRTKLTIFAKAARNRYINRCKAHHF
ncbi:thiamine-phosphate kinase [Sulfurimonas autotrophica]|uniref:Thiamine-monophosphate kinase n=1 Tax=Sulfurimonas autotrophica (strain ATCC BAA-671 / DSM 16294 / JCM 11897 / OK10) TaxID=563040 RepID=E0UTD7_SULAO|nr:thiamine-phosphate kinase [Sulfurimonas autotrophica]ADN09302.1 thiamine-phosphate kinase [Sulfurimonas autotrophica DSM 16294]